MSEKEQYEADPPPGGDYSDSGEGSEEAERPIVTERKRRWLDTNTLLMVGLLLAVAGGTYLMVLSAGAEARGSSTSTATAASTINSFLNKGVENLRQTFNTQRDIEKLVAQFNNYPQTKQVPLSDLKADPFQASDSANTTKSLSINSAELLEKARLAAAEHVADGLKLQSIICGTHSVCMINGKPYFEGEGNDSFTVEKILSDGVWVKVGTLDVEIKMAKPQI